MPLPRLKNSLSKKIPKLSVKLAQSSRDLAQSVKLGVKHCLIFWHQCVTKTFTKSFNIVRMLGSSKMYPL